MNNDLGINTFTSSVTGVYHHSADVAVKYRVSVRAGATSEMIYETVKHFTAAINHLLLGATQVSVNVPERSLWSEKTQHGEARVAIYTLGGLWLKSVDGSKSVNVDINVFTEFTTVQEVLDYTWMLVNTMSEKYAIDLVTSPVSNSKPKSELDEYFPRDNKQAPTTERPTNAHKAPRPGENFVNIGNYDYKQKAAYEATYIGMTVAIDVAQVKRLIAAKKDGTGSYECLQIFGWYNGQPSEHPIYDFTAFPLKEGQNFGAWKTIIDALPAGSLAKPGTSFEGDMQFHYRLNADKNSKTNTDGTPVVYWNLQKVIISETVQVNTTIDIDFANEEEIPF